MLVSSVFPCMQFLMLMVFRAKKNLPLNCSQILDITVGDKFQVLHFCSPVSIFPCSLSILLFYLHVNHCLLTPLISVHANIVNILMPGIKSWEMHTQLVRFYTPLGRLDSFTAVILAPNIRQFTVLNEPQILLIYNISPWGPSLWAWSQLQSAFQWLSAGASRFPVLQQWHL